MKTMLLAAVAVALASHAALADFAADTNTDLLGCPVMMSSGKYAYIYQPPDATMLAEREFLKHCPSSPGLPAGGATPSG